MQRREFVAIGIASLLGLAVGSGVVAAKEKDKFVFTFRKKNQKEVRTASYLAFNLNHAHKQFRADHPEATILNVRHLP